MKKLFTILSLMFFALLPFVLGSCEKEVVRYQEMVEYHAESMNLPAATADSVTSFAQKVQLFVSQHPAAAEDPLYPKIQQNTEQCWLRIKMTANPDWDGENDVEF